MTGNSLKFLLRAHRASLLISALLGLMAYQSAFAHGGVDHNNSCFLSVGDTRLRISGYRIQPELEGNVHARSVGKHYCHFFPELGPIVLAVEPMAEGQGRAFVTLELSVFTARLNPSQAFTVIKQQSAQFMDANLASISQTILQRGIYRLSIRLQDASGNTRQRHFVFLVGFPVTKIMVMIALVLALAIGYVGVRDFNKKP